MDQTEILYHLAVWGIGTIGGCLRAGRDGDYNGFAHLFCVGAVAGMLSFCIVGLCNFYSTGWGITGWAVAAGVGSMGRQIVDTLFVDVAGAIRKKVRDVFGNGEDIENGKKETNNHSPFQDISSETPANPETETGSNSD